MMRLAGGVMLLMLLSGCVRRTMVIDSEPPGAIVWMNDREIGRTPLRRDFSWYGTYDVQVRAEGYETLNTKTEVIAPWWQWPPIDFFVEFWPWPLEDRRIIRYSLKPASTEAADPEEMQARARELRDQLESSRYTREATTQPVQPTE